MVEFDILEKLREQIDRTDEEILILIKRRFQTAKKIAKYKKTNNMQIEDLDRETLLIFERIKKATTMNLPESFVRDIFELVLDQSKKIQKEEFEK